MRPFRHHLFRRRTFSAQIVSSPIRRSSTVQLFRVRVWVSQKALNIFAEKESRGPVEITVQYSHLQLPYLFLNASPKNSKIVISTYLEIRTKLLRNLGKTKSKTYTFPQQQHVCGSIKRHLLMPYKLNVNNLSKLAVCGWYQGFKKCSITKNCVL